MQCVRAPRPPSLRGRGCSLRAAVRSPRLQCIAHAHIRGEEHVRVAEGAQVATVEAMKMNTYIFAPKAGTIAAILVNPGDGVEEGTVMMRMG